MSLSNYTDDSRLNPLDVVERLASGNDWSFERASDDEITILVTGRWTDYQLSYTWMDDIEALHLACAFDLKVPQSRLNEVIRLLSIVNGQVLMGHFDIWRHEDAIIFRQSLLLAGGAEPTDRQVEVLLSNALDSCEAYFQTFQFVVWSGMDAQDAVDAVLFETAGEA